MNLIIVIALASLEPINSLQIWRHYKKDRGVTIKKTDDTLKKTDLCHHEKDRGIIYCSQKRSEIGAQGLFLNYFLNICVSYEANIDMRLHHSLLVRSL